MFILSFGSHVCIMRSLCLSCPLTHGTDALAFMLRWVHLLAGITWVGLLYFFNLVNVPFMKQLDAASKPKVLQYMTMPALQLFRWSAMLTVFMGFWYWAQIYVAADAHRMGVSPGSTIGLFLLIWIAASMILYFVISKNAQRICTGRNHAGAGVRCRLAIRELHAGRPGR